MYTTYREKEIHKSKNPKSPNPAKDSYSKYFQPTFFFFFLTPKHLHFQWDKLKGQLYFLTSDISVFYLCEAYKEHCTSPMVYLD